MANIVRGVIMAAAAVLVALPFAAYVVGRHGLVAPLVGLALAGLASLLAYRSSLALRRRIDEVGGELEEG